MSFRSLFPALLLLPGCFAPCPDGFLRDNAGNCLQVSDDGGGIPQNMVCHIF